MPEQAVPSLPFRVRVCDGDAKYVYSFASLLLYPVDDEPTRCIRKGGYVRPELALLAVALAWKLSLVVQLAPFPDFWRPPAYGRRPRLALP